MKEVITHVWSKAHLKYAILPHCPRRRAGRRKTRYDKRCGNGSGELCWYPGKRSAEYTGADSPPLNLDPLHLKPGVAEKPATKKQMDTITGPLREIPEAKNTLEYQDYRENKTIGNATELIARAAKIGLDNRKCFRFC